MSSLISASVVPERAAPLLGSISEGMLDGWCFRRTYARWWGVLPSSRGDGSRTFSGARGGCRHHALFYFDSIRIPPAGALLPICVVVASPAWTPSPLPLQHDVLSLSLGREAVFSFSLRVLRFSGTRFKSRGIWVTQCPPELGGPLSQWVFGSEWSSVNARSAEMSMRLLLRPSYCCMRVA